MDINPHIQHETAQRAVIYLDNAATTRVAPEVVALMKTCMEQEYGNPASLHDAGIAAQRRVREATIKLAAALGDRSAELGRIVWTSGGTESNALALLGAARARQRRGRRVVCTALEHPAVRECAAQLGAEGFQVAAVPATRQGTVEVECFVDAVTSDTAVAAMMLVNNEIGTILPVAETAAAVKARYPQVHVHCDAVQALGKVELDVAALGIDSLALSSHKIHGPKGAGALWLASRARIRPLWSGGGQQDGLRSGTLNVPGIVGMGEAARLAVADLSRQRAAWERMGARLRGAMGDARVEVREHGAGPARSPHIFSVGFRGIPAEPLLHVLESRGVLVSSGSACAEGSGKPSQVLTAIGVDPAFGTLRFSFGRTTTVEEVDRAASIVLDALRDLGSSPEEKGKTSVVPVQEAREKR